MDLASKYRTALHMKQIFDAPDGTKSMQHSRTLPDKRSAQVHLLAAMATAPSSGVRADGCGGAGCCRMLLLGGGNPGEQAEAGGPPGRASLAWQALSPWPGARQHGSRARARKGAGGWMRLPGCRALWAGRTALIPNPDFPQDH